jgi:hypothetical protein
VQDLEKFTDAQLVKKFPASDVTQDSLPCSKALATGPSSKQAEYSQHHYYPFLKDLFCFHNSFEAH